ncbi:MAG: hypothetical protein ABEH88_13030 [Halobacteriales archaeon]
MEDDGAGIPAEEGADVFEVGYTGTAEGTGLDLILSVTTRWRYSTPRGGEFLHELVTDSMSIVEQVVNAHGWDVRVTAGSDGGARFEITGVEEPGLG